MDEDPWTKSGGWLKPYGETLSVAAPVIGNGETVPTGAEPLVE